MARVGDSSQWPASGSSKKKTIFQEVGTIWHMPSNDKADQQIENDALS